MSTHEYEVLTYSCSQKSEETHTLIYTPWLWRRRHCPP